MCKNNDELINRDHGCVRPPSSFICIDKVLQLPETYLEILDFGKSPEGQVRGILDAFDEVGQDFGDLGGCSQQTQYRG